MTRGRALLLALAVALAPLLQAVGFVWHPVLPEDAAGQLAVVADDPGLWTLLHLTAAGSAALSMVAGPALAGLVTGRGARLATVGAGMLVLGGGLLAMAFAAEAHLLPIAVEASVGAEAGERMVELDHDSVLATMLMAGLPLAGIGQLLLAGGLLRSRAVPTWMPALVLAGTLASLAAAPGAAAGPFLLAPAVVGQVALATRVVRRAPSRPAPAAAEPKVLVEV